MIAGTFPVFPEDVRDLLSLIDGTALTQVVAVLVGDDCQHRVSMIENVLKKLLAPNSKIVRF